MLLSRDSGVVVECLEVSPFFENSYIFGRKERGECVIIDPGDDPDKILERADLHALVVDTILLTHGHLDHVIGCMEIKKRTDCTIAIHSLDKDMYMNASRQGQILGYPAVDQPEPDRLLADGDLLSLCGFDIEVIHTPGHTQGGVCFLSGDILFAGDLLFAGSIGRTDLPGGSYPQLIDSVVKKVFPLDEETVVLPGHGPGTTVGAEKKYNPFFR